MWISLFPVMKRKMLVGWRGYGGMLEKSLGRLVAPGGVRIGLVWEILLVTDGKV